MCMCRLFCNTMWCFSVEMNLDMYLIIYYLLISNYQEGWGGSALNNRLTPPDVCACPIIHNLALHCHVNMRREVLVHFVDIV